MSRRSIILISGVCALVGGPFAKAQQTSQATTGWFQQAQAEQGHQLFNNYCAECHRPDLSGALGPALKGSAFLNKWTGHPLSVLYHFEHTRRRWIATRDSICDQTIALNGFYAAKHYPGQLRRIRYRDPETGKNLVFLTNQFALPAPTICALYRCRWQVELFFKWIKQHLRIKRFYGTSENAVRTQIWIAISVYVLVAIIKKQLRLDVSLHALLQILSLTLFEKLPLKQAVASVEPFPNNQTFHSQLNLFEF